MSPGQPLGRWAGKGEHKMEIMNSGQQKDGCKEKRGCLGREKITRLSLFRLGWRSVPCLRRESMA